MNNIYPYLIITIFILLVDFVWLYVNYNNYNRLVKKIQGSDISVNIIGGFLSYLTVLIGLFYFSIPLITNELNKDKNKSLLILCIKYGGLLGLIMYGIFNTTNIGIFKNYEIYVGLIDTLWGAFLFTISSYIFILIRK
jgi:uncharacterized membrane protein